MLLYPRSVMVDNIHMAINALAEGEDMGQDKSSLLILSERASGYFPHGNRAHAAIPTNTSGTMIMIPNHHSRFHPDQRGKAKSLYRIIDMFVYA